MGHARTPREKVGHALGLGILITVFASAAIYLGDYAILRIRVATNHTPFGTVTVQPLLAVPEKGQKTEFIVQDPHDETCVNSAIAHMGHLPCWYLAAHPTRRIDM